MNSKSKLNEMHEMLKSQPKSKTNQLKKAELQQLDELSKEEQLVYLTQKLSQGLVGTTSPSSSLEENETEEDVTKREEGRKEEEVEEVKSLETLQGVQTGKEKKGDKLNATSLVVLLGATGMGLGAGLLALVDSTDLLALGALIALFQLGLARFSKNKAQIETLEAQLGEEAVEDEPQFLSAVSTGCMDNDKRTVQDLDTIPSSQWSFDSEVLLPAAPPASPVGSSPSKQLSLVEMMENVGPSVSERGSFHYRPSVPETALGVEAAAVAEAGVEADPVNLATLSFEASAGFAEFVEKASNASQQYGEEALAFSDRGSRASTSDDSPLLLVDSEEVEVKGEAGAAQKSLSPRSPSESADEESSEEEDSDEEKEEKEKGEKLPEFMPNGKRRRSNFRPRGKRGKRRGRGARKAAERAAVQMQMQMQNQQMMQQYGYQQMMGGMSSPSPVQYGMSGVSGPYGGAAQGMYPQAAGAAYGQQPGWY